MTIRVHRLFREPSEKTAFGREGTFLRWSLDPKGDNWPTANRGTRWSGTDEAQGHWTILDSSRLPHYQNC